MVISRKARHNPPTDRVNLIDWLKQANGDTWKTFIGNLKIYTVRMSAETNVYETRIFKWNGEAEDYVCETYEPDAAIHAHGDARLAAAMYLSRRERPWRITVDNSPDRPPLPDDLFIHS
jgi:hypothetical protein